MNSSYPMSYGTSDRRSGCMRALGISCLVMIVIGIGVGLWAYHMISNNPTFRQAFMGARDMVMCELNLQNKNDTQDITSALDRYIARHGKYPSNLSELYPDFLEDRGVLHCPADSRPKDEISYEYIAPEMDAPDDTVIVRCTLHSLGDDQPPVVIYLRKDGRVVRDMSKEQPAPAEPEQESTPSVE